MAQVAKERLDLIGDAYHQHKTTHMNNTTSCTQWGWGDGDDNVVYDSHMYAALDNYIPVIRKKVVTFRKRLKGILKNDGFQLVGLANIDISHETHECDYMIRDASLLLKFCFTWTLSNYMKLSAYICVNVSHDEYNRDGYHVYVSKICTDDSDSSINNIYYTTVKKTGTYFKDLLDFLETKGVPNY